MAEDNRHEFSHPPPVHGSGVRRGNRAIQLQRPAVRPVDSAVHLAGHDRGQPVQLARAEPVHVCGGQPAEVYGSERA